MSKYVIKIIRMLPESWKRSSGVGKEEHYFQKMSILRGTEGCDAKSSYDITTQLENANRFTEQEFRGFVEKIKKMYERDKDIGTLLSIEVVDLKPFCPIVMVYKPRSKPETIISRFELMELLDE